MLIIKALISAKTDIIEEPKNLPIIKLIYL
jgi:hypothetical protein